MRKKSLSRRIQKSMMASSMLALLLALITIFSLIIFIAKPVGYIFLEGINEKIVNSFIRSSQSIDMFKVSNDYNFLTYDDLLDIEFSNQSDIVFEHDIEAMKEELSLLDQKTIYIQNDENNLTSIEEKRKVLLAVYKAIQETEGIITIGRIINEDIINIQIEYDGLIEKSIPSEAYLSKINFDKMNSIERKIEIRDNEDQLVGSINTSLDSSVFIILTLVVIFIFFIIAIMTLFIVKLFVRPLTKNLVRPINKLNKQLHKIANNKVEINHVVIEQKKPPIEIDHLITYSNTIMNKLRDSLHEIENHKDELEAQNIELDAQNAELIESQEALKAAQDHLVQSEKLAIVGQLSAAIAHEINTPIGAITSNGQMIEIMLKKLEKSIQDQAFDDALKIMSKLVKSNNISIDAAKRVSEIIRNLRNYSRIDQAKFQNADINEGLQSVLVLTSNLWKNKVSLIEDYDQLPEISCYPSMLNQVFMNLIVNAIQASHKDGKIIVRTKALNDYIKIYIVDNGTGIEETHMNKIFDSGFTTKPKDTGTGLGLSISRDIIHKHHGEIIAYNNEEKGATFEITLPMKQSPSECVSN